MNLLKLELGSGERPTPGYLHQDIIQLETPLDYCCPAWCVPMPEDSLSEVIAIAVMEHLRFKDFSKTMKHIYQLLKPGGKFYFDVPDIKVWATYLFLVLQNPRMENSNIVPYSKEDIYKTMWGWQRWEGDEHKSAWIHDDVYEVVVKAGFSYVTDGLDDIKKRVHRDRFDRPENAHIYIKAVK